MREVALHEACSEPLSFRELCQRVLPPGTRYLVLDLDRTVHFGINLGERLGWELAAHQSYGDATLKRLESSRGRGLFVLHPRRPVALTRFLLRGVQRWARPGLHYLLWGKLAATVPVLQRAAMARHGEHFVQRAQRRTQLTLMRHLREAEAALQKRLAERIWDRMADDQVITREDLQWLRAQHPGLQVIITSASPEPTVSVAANRLGADSMVFSTLERINSGPDKITRLRELHPELFEPSVLSVGITDTQYGEDHCWADCFTVVVAMNSQWPFPRWVADGSPIQAIYSARVLTQGELAARGRGDRGYLDPRRSGLRRQKHRLTRDMLAAKSA